MPNYYLLASYAALAAALILGFVVTASAGPIFF
jgi:hypothetical protein